VSVLRPHGSAWSTPTLVYHQQPFKPFDEPFGIKLYTRAKNPWLVQNKLAKISCAPRSFKGTEGAKGVPQQISGLPHRVYDSRNVFKFALDGIVEAIPTLTPTAPVNCIR
jgi:hypothetical protein